jgi:hypothetical protein
MFNWLMVVQLPQAILMVCLALSEVTTSMNLPPISLAATSHESS